MTGPPRWASRLLGWAAGPDARWLLADLEEEFELLRMERGPAAARHWYAAQALRSIGPLLRRRSLRPSSPRKAPMALGLDVRFALRRARRTPLVTTAIVVTIALGIGATTAVYSVVRGVLLKALPYPDPDRIVRVMTINPARPGDLPSETWLDLQAWHREAGSFEAMGGLWEGGTMRTITFDDRVQRFPVTAVTAGFADVLRMTLLAGRTFTDAEFHPDGPRAVVLGATFWRTQLGADPGVVGRTIVVADTVREIIGVLDNEGSEFPSPSTAMWMPVAPRPGHWMAGGRSRWIAVYARLRPGVTAEAARAELQVLADRSPREPDQPVRVARVTPLVSYLTGPVRPVLLLLSAAVVVALIVACANVAILLMAQAEARVRELAVRSALGGSRRRINRLLAIETMVTAGVGGLLGVALARPLVDLFLRFYPGRLVRAQDISIDPMVLAGAIAAVAIACVAVSWPGARRARRVNLVSDLKDGAGAATAGRAGFRGVLVVLQLAMSVALVSGGLLLVRSFTAIARVDPGFEPRDLSYAILSASPARHPGDRIPELYAEIVERVRALPGVEHAAAVNYLPLPTSVVGWGSNAERTDRPGVEYEIQYRHVTAEYLESMRLPLRRGRPLSAADGKAAPRVALVNETFVAQAFPGEDPLGRTFNLQGQTWEIVGVVGDMRYWGLAKPVMGEIYAPLSQAFSQQAPQFFAGQNLLVRSSHDPVALDAMVREAVRAVDPTMAVGGMTSMAERVDRALAPERFRAMLVGGLGLLALILSGLGIYAVMTWTVARRTREIGIRLALGAPAGRVRGEVLRSALRLTVAGAVLGVPLALAGTRLIRGFLIEVQPDDPITLIGVTVGFLALALFAALVPARRASRVNPLAAIRSE